MDKAHRKEWQPPSLARSLVLMFFIIGANIFDGCSTLEILRRGGFDLNPYVSMAIKNGADSFLTWKTALVTFCAAVLTGLATRFRFASVALHIIAFFFAILTLLHFFLLGLN